MIFSGNCLRYAYGISCVTNFPEATFVCIRKEHTHFGLSVKEIQGRIAFHVLAIWYISAKGVYHTIPLIKEMFYDLELEEECAEILDKFLWLTSDKDVSGAKSKTNNIQIGFRQGTNIKIKYHCKPKQLFFH